MPFALVIIGLIMIISGVRNTHAELGNQLVSDFTGANNFTYWIVSIGAVGSIGYSETLRPISNSFLALILIGFVLKNGGVFDKFIEAIENGPDRPDKMATNDMGIKDNSVDYVSQVGETARQSIKTSANQQSDAGANFSKVADVAIKFLI